VFAKRHFVVLSTLVFIFFALIIFSSRPSEAQNAGGTCSALAEEALNQSGQNCDGLGINAACYGYNRVSVLFNQDVAEDQFSKPADRADVSVLQSIETSAYDQTSDFWGIAVMKLQANIPNTLPGQAVTFILMGETQVQDAVPPESQMLPSAAVITVQPSARSNVRSKPSLRANVLVAVEAGVDLQADAVDETGNWLRVVANGVPGWINRATVGDVDASTLPTITSEAMSPMQAFYLKTKFGKAECDEAPSALLVQGPKNLSIDLSVNGANITIHSTVLFRTIDENTLELIVLDGEAVVDGLVIPTGFRSVISLKDLQVSLPGLAENLQTVSTADGNWTDCLPISDEERVSLQTFTNIPANLLSYPVTIPEGVSGACAQPGSAPPLSSQPSTNTQGVDCSAFRPTSPLGGASYGLNTFYWDAAPGATSYRVKLYDANGNFAGSMDTSGAQTSLDLDTAIAGTGYSFSWEVEALVDGQSACSSNRVTMGLGAPPAPQNLPVGTPGPTPT
jgi:hypothetical protein